MRRILGAVLASTLALGIWFAVTTQGPGGFLSWLTAVAEANRVRSTGPCGDITLDLQNSASAPNSLYVDFVLVPQFPDTLDYVNYKIWWINWSLSSGFAHGTIEDEGNGWPFLNRYEDAWIVTSGAGYITGGVTGYTLLNGASTQCIYGSVNTRTDVGGTGYQGVQYAGGDLPYPTTADVDNNNHNDDAHCDICDKKDDQLQESQENDLRIKVCSTLDKINDYIAWKSCKGSGNLAIGAREGRGWDCWYHVNRNGWQGPTAPENAPNHPITGAPYNDKYFGTCGYQLPTATPFPTVVGTRVPRPTLDRGGCVQDGAGQWDCGGDGVHALTHPVYVEVTATPRPTATLVVPNPPWIQQTGDDIHFADAITVTWDYVPSGQLGKHNYAMLYQLSPNAGRNNSNYFYTNNCTKVYNSNDAAKASGSCTLTLTGSGTVNTGTYQWRLYTDENMTTLITKGNTVTITNP